MAWCALAIAGCGPGDGRVEVSGSVTFDGKPIERGSIVFTPEVKGSPDGGKIIDGQFRLRALVGKHRIKIEASRPTGPFVPSMGGHVHEEYIPARYNSKTTLSEEVTPGGDNSFSFRLTSKGE
jgi:hypothetical protein